MPKIEFDEVGPHPWEIANEQMKAKGFSLKKIPEPQFNEHMWADGLWFFWHRNKRLPNAAELAYDMFDEWDDPVSLDEAQAILNYLEGVDG